ncbi:hypothetical protein AgCh_026137 [Apium graveolens]
MSAKSLKASRAVLVFNGCPGWRTLESSCTLHPRAWDHLSCYLVGYPHSGDRDASGIWGELWLYLRPHIERGKKLRAEKESPLTLINLSLKQPQTTTHRLIFRRKTTVVDLNPGEKPQTLLLPDFSVNKGDKQNKRRNDSTSLHMDDECGTDILYSGGLFLCFNQGDKQNKRRNDSTSLHMDDECGTDILTFIYARRVT